MLSLMMAAAAAALTPLSDQLKGQLQAAIFADLQMNAMIGNGNWLGSLWYNAGSDAGPDLHISDLRCAMDHAGRQCSFSLLRDGGPSMALGQAAPDKLACVARFARHRDGWSVVHTPPRRTGHSQTTMKCKV
jgi:hypothetical protein